LKKVIAFAPEFNTLGKRDATGAFRPDAERYLKLHTFPMTPWLFDNRKGDATRRKTVLSVLQRQSLIVDQNLDAVAFFCHGSKDHIQAGFHIRNLGELARALSDVASYRDNLIVTLYACDAARDLDKDRLDDLKEFGGDGGFADELRDALCRAGQIHCRVDAHTTAGDDDQNPNVRRFEGNGSPVGCVGGHYIIPRGSRLWKRWFKAVRTTDFRWRFPFMTDLEIVAYLESV